MAKKCLTLEIIQKKKYYDNSNNAMTSKMKDETSDISIEQFVGLESKTYSFVKDNTGEYKKGINKKVAAEITHENTTFFSLFES